MSSHDFCKTFIFALLDKKLHDTVFLNYRDFPLGIVNIL